MTYLIKYYYQTGDSFSNEDREEVLDIKFESLEVAKDNLRRIEEHYKAYEKVNGWYPPEDTQAILEQYSQNDWYCKHRRKLDRYDLLSIVLYTDEGKEYRMSCPWTGYFERLYGANIIEDREGLEFHTCWSKY